jgi:hypothetical protein
MTCYNHPGMGTVAICERCNKEICAICKTTVGDMVVCRDCADIVRKEQPVPAPEETKPEEAMPAESQPAGTKPEEPEPAATAPVEEKSTLPAVSEPPRVPAPVKPATLAPVTPSSPPAAHDAGAGSPRKKESLLSAALSLVLPGAGQAYNGQIVKGVILAALYLGSIAAIMIFIVAAAMFAPWACCFCLPAFILPLIVLVYAIYDAYDTAEKINNGKEAKDWF